MAMAPYHILNVVCA